MWFEIFALVLLAFLPAILMYLFVEVKILVNAVPMIREIIASSRPDFAHTLTMVFQVAKSNFWLLMLSKVVMLLNLPFALGALMYAYENLFGPRTTPGA